MLEKKKKKKKKVKKKFSHTNTESRRHCVFEISANMSDDNDTSNSWAVVARRGAKKAAADVSAKASAEAKALAAAAAARNAALLVLDTAALIQPSLSLLSNPKVVLCTVREVLDEVRDRRARLALDALPADIDVREPAPVHAKAVVDFAKKTGDFSVLSAVDLKLLALARQCAVEVLGPDSIRDAPLPVVTSQYPRPGDSDAASTTTATTAAPAASIDDDGFRVVGNGDAVTTADAVVDDDDDNADDDDESSTSSDGSEWITPENLAAIREKARFGETSDESVIDHAAEVKIACMTADFAMQNVLVQMGIRVVAPNGMMIARAQQWILRCFACGLLVTDADKLFCPACGNHTLKRVALTLDEETGEQRVLISRRPINVRGTRFPLPAPRGGRNDPGDLILCESDVLRKYRGRTKPKKRREEYDFGEMSRPKAHMKPIVVGVGKKNPNAARKAVGKANRSHNRFTAV
jgi:RNA-binding protein NOB1